MRRRQRSVWPVRVFGAKKNYHDNKIVFIIRDSQVYPVNMNPVKFFSYFFFFLWLITRGRYENNGVRVLI
jgi:hypothetical protein